jgi:protocatechuate 3,4-dioxygenase beta subunit
LALPVVLKLASGHSAQAVAQIRTLPLTPACAEQDDVTPAQTEGPYYKRNSPQRTSLLEPGSTGATLVVTGSVLARDCQPIARALVDFWQADAQGVYDNVGSKLRGHQFTDEAGRYTLETVVPGRYPGRTRHLHVKVQAPNQPALTTQLYFPGESSNTADRLFNPHLLMTMQDTNGSQAATFHFVLESQPSKTRAR